MNQTTPQTDELEGLLTQKKQLEKSVEYFRQEYKTARGKAREHKRMLREVKFKIKAIEVK